MWSLLALRSLLHSSVSFAPLHHETYALVVRRSG
uniref:Uncharacterized protein n=1 Tax=Anguilla anguilla TaxID=7936 RepID=A0A0E9Y2E9_ANGAN